MTDFFDRANEYNDLLNKGLVYTGEDKYYYINGRLNVVKHNLPEGFSPKRILDFGCGIGDATIELSKIFPDAEVIGIDTAENAIKYAAEKHSKNNKLKFFVLNDYNEVNTIDLCYINGVFHHIEPVDRPLAIQKIFNLLNAKGILAYFENNPWNPGTKFIMSRIPFDKDAKTISYKNSIRMLKKEGFELISSTNFLFFFPRMLKVFRPLEKLLRKIPFGGQYLILLKKDV